MPQGYISLQRLNPYRKGKMVDLCLCPPLDVIPINQSKQGMIDRSMYFSCKALGINFDSEMRTIVDWKIVSQ